MSQPVSCDQILYDLYVDRMNQMCKRNCIPGFMKEDLKVLNAYEIVLIYDDSAEMRQSILGTTIWKELEQVTETIVDICSAIYEDGINIHFINKGLRSN